jgi:L-amino acid N-acyltransferase YncA
MTIELREPTDADWPDIQRVANEALPRAADGNAAWLANRRAFGETGRERPQYVAVDANRRIVAYGAIEEDAGGARYGLFVVMGAERLAGGVGAAMYDRLRRHLDKLGARTAWMREQADDAAILAFASERGFGETHRFVFDGIEIVTLELGLGATT